MTLYELFFGRKAGTWRDTTLGYCQVLTSSTHDGMAGNYNTPLNDLFNRTFCEDSRCLHASWPPFETTQPTTHTLINGDARDLSFLGEESVHLGLRRRLIGISNDITITLINLVTLNSMKHFY